MTTCRLLSPDGATLAEGDLLDLLPRQRRTPGSRVVKVGPDGQDVLLAGSPPPPRGPKDGPTVIRAPRVSKATQATEPRPKATPKPRPSRAKPWTPRPCPREGCPNLTTDPRARWCSKACNNLGNKAARSRPPEAAE